MTPDRLLTWLIARSVQREGIPVAEIPAENVDALMSLAADGRVMLTNSPPLAWIHPSCYKRRRRMARAEVTFVESDLPPDIGPLDGFPDADSRPPYGQRRNGEPIYRPRDEPSELVAMGPTPWPPAGTEIHARHYREPRAVYTEVTVSDLYVTADACPVCGKADTRGRKQTSNNPTCLCCDLWGKNITGAVTTLETPPEVEIEPKKKRRKAG